MHTTLHEDTQAMINTIKNIQKHADYEYTLSKQCSLPKKFSGKKHIVIAGMGGSGLCADIIRTLHQKQLQTPIYIVQDYALPEWVNTESLIICISYSGNTEEVLSVFNHASQKNYDIIAISSGGKLEYEANARQIPFYKINDTFNSANQPRLSILPMYEIVLNTLTTLGYVSNHIRPNWNQVQPLEDITSDVRTLNDSPLIIVAAEHLAGTAHAMSNIINENAKRHAHHHIVPECTHHMIEALVDNSRYRCIVLESKHYDARNTKRIQLMKNILLERKIPAIYLNNQTDPINESRTAILYACYVSIGLAATHNINPRTIPTIEAFKQALAQA